MAFTTNGNMHRHMRTHGMESADNTVISHDNNHTGNSNHNINSHNNGLHCGLSKLKSKKRKSIEEAQLERKFFSSLDLSKPRRYSQASHNGDSKSINLDNNDMIEKEWTCQICDKKFIDKLSLYYHLATHPNETLKCIDCGYSLANYASLTQHKCLNSISKSLNKTGPNEPHPVGFYDLTFTDFSSNKFSLIAKSFCEHNIRKSSSSYHEFECSKCERAFPCRSALNLHESTHSDTTYCSICNCDLGSPSLFISHQMKHRFDESAQPNDIFSSSTSKNSQLNGFHSNLTKDENNRDAITEKEGFLAMLQLHNKSLESMMKLSSNDHLNPEDSHFDHPSYFLNATPLPAFKSTSKSLTNGKLSSSSGEQSKHDLADIQSIISVITTATPLITNMRSSPLAASPASPVEAKTGVNHYNHSAQVASPIHASSDSVASKELSIEEEDDEDDVEDDEERVEHDVDHSSQMEDRKEDGNDTLKQSSDCQSLESFKCKVCNLFFKSLNALKRHSRGHTKTSHSYACLICPYTSLDKSTLVRHLRTHNGERPFQCAICKYAFTTKANCERHVKKRHKKLSKIEIKNSMQYNSNLSTSSVSSLTIQNINKHNSIVPVMGKFPDSNKTVCKYCNVDFKFNRVLRHHLRSNHNSCNQKPYSCTLCKIGFSTKNNCLRHVIRLHPELKDDISSIVIANRSSYASHTGSDYSHPESGSLDNTDLELDFGKRVNSFGSTSSEIHSLGSLVAAQQSHSSLAALCQIAGVMSPLDTNGPLNLASFKEGYDYEESDENGDDQPLDLATNGDEVDLQDDEDDDDDDEKDEEVREEERTNGVDRDNQDNNRINNRIRFERGPFRGRKNHVTDNQPLDLALHALDLSVKAGKETQPMQTESIDDNLKMWSRNFTALRIP